MRVLLAAGSGQETLDEADKAHSFRAAVRRGKPLRFWRDRLIMAFFSGGRVTR